MEAAINECLVAPMPNFAQQSSQDVSAEELVSCYLSFSDVYLIHLLNSRLAGQKERKTSAISKNQIAHWPQSSPGQF